MKRLNYNIYTNISDESFINTTELLMPLESKMVEMLKNDGWRLHSPVALSDGLAVDFVKKDGILHGNMGFKFDDLPTAITFTFYITKSFDENHHRYFLRNDIFVKKGISFFEDKIIEYTALSLQKYNSWSKSEIRMLGQQSTLG